jgi:anaerobic magnesium-protoporphyrin IX monomethyl ester cyclase
MHVALVGAEFEENLAVRYLRGAVEHAGHDVTSVVFNDAGQTELAARQIAESGAAIAGFSMVFTYRAREFARLAERTRELGYRGHIVAGGHFAAMHAEQLLNDVRAFDSIACGEGEPILCQLCDALPEPAGVAGLVWRNGEQLVRNAAAVKPPDLDVLPFPPRKQPFDDYLGIPITNILSSRGCTRNCAFCSIAAWHRMCGGDRLRLRAPERLADEMALLYRQGVRIFNFHDDNFVLDDKVAMLRRTHALGAALAERGVLSGIAFAIKCRPDVVDAELFALLKAIGLFRVFLGVEAGTAESLRQLGRGQSVDDNVRALEILARLDIHSCFNLLLLNPDSTLADLAANVEFLRKHPRHAMNFCRTEVYAGTPLERRLRREGRLRGDYWGYDYEIADARAQTAFEIIYPAFEARNYGDEGLHHLTMQIDYEQQLLRRFFGRHEALRRRVKRQIVAVNNNTCEHLRAVIARIPELDSRADRDAFAAEIRGRVQRDNQRLGRQVNELLDQIRSLPSGPAARRRASSWMHAAARAGIAASVTLASGACKDKSHPTEMIAAPTLTSSGPPPAPTEDASLPPAKDASLPTGPAVLVKPTVRERLMPLLEQKLSPGQAVEIEIWVASDGSVSNARLHRPQLDADSEQSILAEARKIHFSAANVRGQRFVIIFLPDEIAGARPDASAARPPPRPPRPEMAPRPPPRPEMAPRPPKPDPGF